MKRKAVAALMAVSMLASMAACGNSNDNTSASTEAGKTEAAGTEAAETEAPAAELSYDGEIKIWVADAAVDFTNQQIEAFKAANPGVANATFTVEAVGEGDAAGNVITDVEAGADIYGFAQDQIARLVAAGALEVVAPENEDAVKTENDEGAVNAASVGGELYAYPLTSDNGYFMYYDKSVITDPTSLEQILADCEAAGVNFNMEINSGWYQTAFFFGTGCEFTYETNTEGKFTSVNQDYASEKGLAALKAMIALNSSKAFVNGSSIENATNLGAIVDGTWDVNNAKAVFGDNFACAKLPSFTVDGTDYQMSGFSGYKLLGVKPQTDEDKLAVCDALALFLSSEEVQVARYNELGWGPSNLAAKENEAVKADEALAALNEQMLEDIPQGQYPGSYWDLATGLGDSIISGELTADTSDDDLMAVLQDFQDTCASYLDAE